MGYIEFYLCLSCMQINKTTFLEKKVWKIHLGWWIEQANSKFIFIPNECLFLSNNISLIEGRLFNTEFHSGRVDMFLDPDTELVLLVYSLTEDKHSIKSEIRLN